MRSLGYIYYHGEKMDRVKLFIEKFAYPYMEKRMGNQIRGMLNELKKYESFTPQQLTALRKKKLEYLLTECIHSVPAYEPYKHLEEEIKNNPAAALKQFPVLTKDNFREGFYSYLNKGAKPCCPGGEFLPGAQPVSR